LHVVVAIRVFKLRRRGYGGWVFVFLDILAYIMFVGGFIGFLALMLKAVEINIKAYRMIQQEFEKMKE